MVNVGDKIKLEYTDLDGKSVWKSEIKTILKIEHYNKDLYIVTFNEDSFRSYVYFMESLDKMLYGEMSNGIYKW